MANVEELAKRLSGASVLVTGGAGFIGSHLVEACVEAGADVVVLDNLQAGKWTNLSGVAGKVSCVEADIRSPEEVARVVAEHNPRFVFHLAANASVPGSVQDPVYDFEANALGTFVVLNSLRGSDCEKIVAASSGAVYGEPISFPIKETDELRPISPYGGTKLNTEVTSRVLHSVYKTPVTLARIFNSYGPRMARFVMLDFLRKLQADPLRLEILGNGKQVRDFTYVSDTVQGLLVLALSGEPGEAYNISSGKSYSVTDMANELLRVRGLSGKTELHYTGSSWVGDAQRWEVDIEKLKALEYTPAFSLEAGLRNTADWFDESFA